jgi:Ca2+:H+ antiporter
MLTRADWLRLGVAVVATVGAGVANRVGAPPVAQFVVAAIALAVLASLVGEATERLGDRLGPGATGVLQSALGNLPELFVGIFALRAGLVGVVQASLVGSILGNSLLVLGLAFVVGGARHGVQHFASDPPRMISTMTLLAVAALAMPTLVHSLHTPAEPHAEALSIACAIVLLVVFAGSIPFALRGGPTAVSRGAAEPEEPGEVWPVWLAGVMLAAAGVGAALASDWFVAALRPAMATLGLSEAFTGLVVVAIAGNAIENVVGVQLAARNQSDYAFSLVINSPLQIALVLAPALVILSQVFGFTALTLVFSPMLVAAVVLSVLIAVVITVDGESNWIEGAALIGVYIVIAASFWWG